MNAPAPELRDAASDAARVERFLADVHLEGVDALRIGEGPRIAAPPRPAPAAPARADAAPCALPALRDALAAAAYGAAYARLYAGPGYDPAASARPIAADASLIAALDAANPSRAAWEPGWRVFQRDYDGSVHVAKGERAVKLPPGRYALPDRARSGGVGDEVERRRDRASLTVQPGLYYAFGEAAPSDYDDARLARFYFDVGADSAAWLLARLAAILNRYVVPFSFKCPVDPTAFDRLDSAVLYVARRYAPTVTALLNPLEAELRARLRGGVPLWTRRLVDGLGFADDPGTGESFGQSRCALLAAGVVDAWVAGRVDLGSRLAAVGDRFGTAGLDVARPHLAPGLEEIAMELPS